MTKAELIELDEEAAIVCKCAPSIDAATLNRTEGEKEEGNG
jgi:hypothetical protein